MIILLNSTSQLFELQHFKIEMDNDETHLFCQLKQGHGLCKAQRIQFAFNGRHRQNILENVFEVSESLQVVFLCES
jgi:hypothetical protein